MAQGEPTPASNVSSPAGVASTPATGKGENDVNESPRERGRILLKRNPIASEYQGSGTLGLSPGASADGEGVDARAFFRLPGYATGDPAREVEVEMNLQSRNGAPQWGGALRWGELLGEGTVAQVHLRQSRSARTIEHYQAAWLELAGAEAGTFFLDRPRFSRDLYETENSLLRWRVDHVAPSGWKAAYEGSLQLYDDVFYRNRMEYRFARGFVEDEAARGKDGTTVLQGHSDNASIRRYFGNTVTDRLAHRHQFELGWESDERAINFVGYYGVWRNQPTWDGWNFYDRGLQLAYEIEDPYLPEIRALDGKDVQDTSQSEFNDFRIYDTITTDTDYAARLDFDQKLKLAGRTLWLSMGGLWRSKERVNEYDQQAFLAVPGAGFSLAEVDKNNPGGPILDGHYKLPRGLDPAAGRAFFEANRDSFFDFAKNETILKSAEGRYRSEETVRGLFLLAYQRLGSWRWEAGLRREWTENATAGINTGPREVLENLPGDFVDELTVAGQSYAVSEGVDFPRKDAHGDPFVETVFIKEVPGSKTYDQLLPSLEIRYEPAEKAWAVRAAYYQVLMRPQYFDIVEYRRVAAPTRTISEGNPNLQPTLIDNFAIALDWDGGAFGEWSFEVYEKRIRDFFYGASTKESLDGETYSVSRVENGESGSLRGFQVQWSGALADWPGAGQKLSMDIGYTYSEGEARLPDASGAMVTIPMPERSRHLLRTALSWRAAKWSYATAFSYQSQALDGLGESRAEDGYRKPVIEWDHTVSRTLREGWSLRLALSNILNHPERGYDGMALRVTQNQFSFFSVRAALVGRF